jgi:hypothetical protein
MKTITITILGILMITGVLAFYPGETIEVPNEMGIENLVWTIIDNSTVIPELNILVNSENITITFPGDMQPDSFKIVFIEESTREVVQTVYKSGGGSTKYIDRNNTVEVPVYVEKNITNEIILEPEKEIIEVEKTNIVQNIVAFILGMILLFLLILFYNKITEKELKE